MCDEPDLIRRAPEVLTPDPRRVITRFFRPGQELLADGRSRAEAIIHRVLDLSEADVATALADVDRRFLTRHRTLHATLLEHFAAIENLGPDAAAWSEPRRRLIGAFFSQEVAVEAAALFNPSMVVHPDQSGLGPEDVRFVMSVRAVGEGHVSSIEFRTGVLTGAGELRLDDPGRYLATGRRGPGTISRKFLGEALADHVDGSAARRLLALLPDRLDADDLDAAITALVNDGVRDQGPPGSADAVIDRTRWVAACNYQLTFAAVTSLAERVIYPVGPDESHGIEDARFTRFVDDDARVRYYAFYTAFDGGKVAPHLLRTDDFCTFDMMQLSGPAARDKGMALFPRRVQGQYLAISRWDRESIGVTSSPDAQNWGTPVTVRTALHWWELTQLGNCGPPIETPDGWLVLTHGVGPMRTYGISAVLLDLDDPTTLLGALAEPILTPSEAERDGYVPNVVYSCGAMVHGQTLVLPYGCSDSSIRFAFVDLPELLKRLRS